ncbi:MAG: hypothetical protein U9R29_07955 [Thermodesulfobacteriota bacterium]|nr:hypothetical protein [Thermodesulfobacteriota bacterium]
MPLSGEICLATSASEALETEENWFEIEGQPTADLPLLFFF